MSALMGSDSRVAKRRKLSADEVPAARQSRVFSPFRTVGLVSPTPVPFTAIPIGKTSFQITTSVGQSLQTFDLKRGLNLVFITRPQTPGAITATVAWADRVAAAWSHGEQRGIWIYKRGKKVGELVHDSEEDIVQLVAFGSWIVACCRTKIEVWSASTSEHYTTLHSPTETVLTGGICTMPTYTNKIFAGREDGSVEIWNVSTGKLIYRIQPPSSDAGPVTSIEPTPALSMLAIAYLGGQLVIQDARCDREIIRLHAGSSEAAPITCISFRTDGLGAGGDGRDAGVMATASFASGHVTLWDLNNGGRRMGTLRSAHADPDSSGASGGISKVEFLPGQAVLVTTGLDNSLKTWIFDESPFSPIPRILHSRSGHAGPVTTLNFLPNDAEGVEAQGKWLLSSSADKSLWGFSLRRDAQSTELSQGSLQKKAKKRGMGASALAAADFKAPEITCLACSLNRDGGMGALPGTKTLWASAKQLKGRSTATEQNITGWESIVTGHKDDRFARTWFWGRKRAGRWVFETGDGGNVSTVAVSPCGSFALVGSVSGSVDMYNLQSGLHRQRYPPKLTPAQAQAQAQSVQQPGTWLKGQGKHTGAITGLHVDNLNRTVISCGADGRVKFWDFATGLLTHQLDWSSQTSVEAIRAHRPSEIVALSCKDHCIRVVDTETRKIVRELVASDSTINDFTFSNDGRWIIAACSDFLVRIWDLPTGHLVDAIRLASPCTALAFSNTGEYLALARQDSVGVDIWTNRTLFTHVPTQQISEESIAQSIAPSASGEGGRGTLAAAFDEDEVEQQAEAELLPTLDQLSSSVETLSLVPKSRWQTLLNLDLIRQRNKPKEPPKAPEKAPFFLPTLLQQNKQVGMDEEQVEPSGIQSRLLRMDRSATESKVTLLLRHNESVQLVEHLKMLTPAVADTEIRSLTQNELSGFVRALTHRLLARQDYELVQAWMAVFLRVHSEAIDESVEDDEQQEREELREEMMRWRAEQQREAERLSGLSSYCAGILNFLRSV